MPVEMIGWIAPRVSSELTPPSGPPFDANVIAETARIHERAGFDRVLIGYFSDAPDGFLVGAHAASVTERLGFLLAHRPGFVAPPVAARKLATLDQLSGGRLAVHIIAGGSDADQAKDGDWTDHDARYRRSTEYVSLLRRTWTNPAPFDHQGEFYRTRGTHSEIRCRQQPHIPIYGGGGSEAAIRSLAAHVDVYMLWGEPLKDTALFIDRVRQEAALYRRKPTFSLSTRPILAATEGKAWDRARAILDRGCSTAAALPHQSARMSALTGSWRRPQKPRCTTRVCGHRLPSRPARKGTRRPWSAPPKRSPRRCSNTSNWAPPAS
jgi:alkanesulfonate monooxygenase